jgi:hypothetical protein
MYTLALSLEIISILLMVVSLIHIKLEEGTFTSPLPMRTLRELLMSSTGYRMNYHVGVFIGFSSILWALHLIYVALPVSRGALPGVPYYVMEYFVSGKWVDLSSTPDAQYHIHYSSVDSGTALITFTGGISSVAMSIPLSDVAHHHLALGGSYGLGLSFYQDSLHLHWAEDEECLWCLRFPRCVRCSAKCFS